MNERVDNKRVTSCKNKTKKKNRKKKQKEKIKGRS